jgi:hypothetical protein
MAFDDLPLDRSAPPPSLQRPSAPATTTRWVVIGSVAVVVGALLALWWMSRAQPGTAVPAPTNATDVTVGSNRPKRQPLELPSLDGSDTLLRDLIASLSRHPLLARLLAGGGIVRGAALAVDQIGDGRTPAVPLKALRPTGRLAIVGGGETGRVDPRTYARWDGATSALVSINPTDAAQLYVNVKPLFDQAYRELGHREGDFDLAIVRAIQTLAETPDVSTDPELLRRSGYYEHADAALRSILPVQKQFLLVGPENRRRVMSWLRRLATALDLKLN